MSASHTNEAESEELTIYVIYKNPSDYPDKFVVRKWTTCGGCGEPVPDEDPIIVTDDVQAARDTMPKGLGAFAPQEGDAPCILEVWF